MLQTTSLISMLGGPAQLKSALHAQQAMPGVDPAAGLLAGADQKPIGSPEQQGSLFQVILNFMQAPSTASASALQERLKNSLPVAQQLESGDSSITLPFPLEANDAPSAEDQSASGVMPFAPFMFTSLAQLQQMIAAAMRDQSPAASGDESAKAVQQDVIAALGLASGINAAAAAPADRTASAARATTESTPAEQAPGSAVPASFVPAAPADQRPAQAAASAEAQSASGTTAPAQELSAPVNTNISMDAFAGKAAAPSMQRELQTTAAKAQPAAGAEAKSNPASSTQSEAAAHNAADLQTALREADENAEQQTVRSAMPAQKSAAASAAGSPTDAQEATAAATEPARTPEVFTMLHEMIAQAAEPAMPKNAAKTAPIQQTRANQKPPAASDSRTLSAQDLKQTAVASAVDEPIGAQQVSARAAAAQASEQAAANVQTKQAQDGQQSTQHGDSAAADTLRAVKTDGQIPHSALASNDVQARAAITERDSTPELTPRVKEDVFDKVFREVSAIKHTPASVDVTLSPESLGKVTVNVGMDEGKMSARINVQNTDVKQIMEANMSRLQDALHSSGLALDSIAVFVNNGSSFAERRGDAPKKKQAAADHAAESAVEMLGSPQDAKQYGYNTVEYIM